MNRFELELHINQIDPSSFQRLGDLLLQKQGFSVVPFGNCEGKKRTRKGTPDSYYVDDKSGDVVFVEYSVQEDDVRKKIFKDLDSCFIKNSFLNGKPLKKIIYFSSSDNIDPSILICARDICKKQGIDFTLLNCFQICHLLCSYKSIVKEIFNEELETHEALTLDQFVERTKLLKGVDHSFKFVSREKDKQAVLDSLHSNFVTILQGKSGVGKSMLAVSVLWTYAPNVLCVNYSNENSLDYLFEHLDSHKTSFLFLDDVNDIASFGRFLDSLTEETIKNIRILCTVRDYALKPVNDLVKKYSFRSICLAIEKLDNESVKELLSINLNIKNPKWLERIAEISRGNPRLAVMAGKIAIDEGVTNLIDSKMILKRYFDISTNDHIKKIIDEYFDVLGILAFMRRTDLNNLESYSKLFELCGITTNRLLNSVKVLESAELISVFEGRIVQIEDQHMSDFFVEKAFVQEKICSLSILIKELFPQRKKEIIELINIVLNIYSSEESRKYVESEINEVWCQIDGTNSFDAFIKTFYPMNITKALVYLSKRIPQCYASISEDNETFEKTHNQDDYVSIIFHIVKDFHSAEAFDLLILCLDYSDIRDSAFEAIKSLASLRPEMVSKNAIHNDSIFSIARYENKAWFNSVLLAILEESLKFEYRYSSFDGEDKMYFSHFRLVDSCPGVLDYRAKIWNLSSALNDDGKYKLLELFAGYLPNEDSKSIFLNDLKHINSLIKTIRHVDEIKEELFKIKMSYSLSNLKIKNDAISIHSEIEMQKIVFIIDPRDKRISFKERKNKHIEKVREYARKASVEDIKAAIILSERIKAADREQEYKVHDFVRLLTESVPPSVSCCLLDNEFLSMLSCEVKCLLLNACFNNGNREMVLELFNDFEHDPDILEASFYILNFIKKEEIDNELQALFARSWMADLKLDSCCSCRRTDTLYNFSKDDNDFVNKICLLHSLKEHFEQKYLSWIGLLFNEHVFKPDHLVHMFVDASRLTVLEEIILFCSKRGRFQYELQEYFFAVGLIDVNFFDSFVDKMLDYTENINRDIFHNIWKEDNCFFFADRIFDRICSSKNITLTPLSITQIFTKGEFGRGEDSVFLTWAMEKIDRIRSEKAISLLTDLVSQCGGETVERYYLKLVNKNVNIALFKKLLRYPLSYSWTGSETTVYISKIKRMKNILTLIPSGIKKLEYKVCIEEYIEDLNKGITQVRIDEKLNRHRD